MTDLKLKAEKRDVLGKKTRFLRRQGVTPAHIFGHGIESLALQCDSLELQHIVRRSGATRLIDINIKGEKHPRSAFIREVQQNTLSGQLLHVDFYQINKTEKITADIPVVLTGESPALKTKDNMLEHMLNEIGVECLPGNMPPQIEIDISILEEAGQAVHVKDLALGADITVTTDPEQVIVKIIRTKMAAAEEAEEAAEAEAAETAAGTGAAAEEEAQEE